MVLLRDIFISLLSEQVLEGKDTFQKTSDNTKSIGQKIEPRDDPLSLSLRSSFFGCNVSVITFRVR